MSHETLKETSNIIVRNGHFESDNSLSHEKMLELDASAKAEDLLSAAQQIDIIVISFLTFADGRGFSLASQLREMGFVGVLRARGNLLPDQYPLAIRCGFDEIEISKNRADRQPERQWLDVYKRVKNNYLDRLMLR